MSRGGAGGARVPIPAGSRKIVQNLKEIAGSHSEDEIYAMLEECAMDPNEAAQKLLLQDHFHEVKKKHDKRKEVVKEPADPRWRFGGQVRGGRGDRGNFSSRYVPYVGARNVNSRKENGVNQGLEKVNKSLSSEISDTGSVSGIANYPNNSDNPMAQVYDDNSMISREENSAETSKLGTVKIIHNDVKSDSASGQSLPTSDAISSTKTSSSVSVVYTSISDPLLVPSRDMKNLGELGNIKRVVGSQQTLTEMTHKAKLEGPDTNQLSDVPPQVAISSSSTGLAGSRPSSSFSNRSQQINGSQKVVANKEWKPKSTNANPVQPSGMLDTFEVPVTAEAVGQSLVVEYSMNPEETASKLEKRLGEMHLDRHHVIIPNHLQVPETVTHGLSFGSFDAGFKLNMDVANGPASDKSLTPPSGSSQDIEKNAEQHSLSINTESTAALEMEYAALPTQVTENYSSREASVSSLSASQEYDQPKQEPTIAQDGPSFSGVQATSISTFGLVPQMLESQVAPSEIPETQPHDDTPIPSFVVQPPFDPSTAYYTQFYLPTADVDGRFSPFHTLGGGSGKFNGRVGVLPAQSGQAPVESGNSVVLPTVGSTPPTAQAAGVMQSSLNVPQQPVTLFRQPAGLHISHYSPNYIPYNQYIPPFYVPPPALHHFLGSAAFPQPPAGSVYPPPGAVAVATPVKYSLSQYKPGANNGNSALIGMPTNYGTYNSNPAGYTSSTPVTSSNSNGSEDLSTSQFKENNVYMTGQQSDGSAVWIPAPGRDMSSLHASSFYGIPPQGQHMTFAPTQVGHGAFSGIYHPTPAVATAAVHPLLQQSQTVTGAVEMVGPPAGVYQQPQRGQMNWNSNY